LHCGRPVPSKGKGQPEYVGNVNRIAGRMGLTMGPTRFDVGALLWVTYGVLIKASPVIVANVLVLSAAA